jgi:urease accessory protein
VTSSPLPTLLHLCDSLFPTGGFSHSDGLESATDAALVVSATNLGAWMDTLLDDAIAACDAPVVRDAWRAFGTCDWPALLQLDAEAHALRPSAASRRASRAMGSRLLRTWQFLYPTPQLDAICAQFGPDGGLTLPAAFGVVTAAGGADLQAAIEAYAYTRLAAAASAAMRLMRIGQHQAHGVLASRLARVTAIAGEVAGGTSAPSMFAPAFDIASMSHQYVHSRLFRS